MRVAWEWIAVWMVRIAKYVSPRGWMMITRDELLKQAEEALAANQAAIEADHQVTVKEQERDAALQQARDLTHAAEQAVVEAVENRTQALVFANEQLVEANAALIAFVKGDAATPSDPAVG